MALSSDILETYRRPGVVIKRLLAERGTESFALGLAMMSCILMFVARWPSLARAAHLDPSIPLPARMGGAMVGLVIILPLILYGLAAMLHLIARVFGATGGFLSARLSLFWALFVTMPLFLALGLVEGFAGRGALSQVFGFVVLACLIVIGTKCFKTAEFPKDKP